MMTDLACRETFVKELEDFLTKAENEIEKFLCSVGWTKEHLINKQKHNYVSCPFNSEHKMPTATLQKHTELCEWIKAGHSKEEKEMEVPSSKFFYENASGVVTVIIDKALQCQILQSQPQQSSANFAVLSNQSDINTSGVKTELTVAERSAIHDYVVAEAKAANVQHNVQLEDLGQATSERRMNEEPQKEKSRLEILAEQRDYKRRRQTYRAKNVHITKKSYTEVMRDLIDNQMKALNPNWEDDENSCPTSRSSSPVPKEQKYSSKREEQTTFAREPVKRSSSRDGHRTRRSRSRESDRHSRREEKPSRPNSRRSYTPSCDQPKRSDERFRRDRSREKSRMHHTKSHKKHSRHHYSSSGDD